MVVKLSGKEINILRKINKESKWKEVKDIKAIKDEIDDLDIYEEKIQLGCSRYLNEDVVKSKEFDVEEMFRNCREAEKVRKRVKKKEAKEAKGGGGRGGRGGRGSQDARLLSKKSKEELDKEEQDKKDKKLIDTGKEVFNQLVKNNGNIEKTIASLVNNKELVNKAYDRGMGIVLGMYNYFWNGEGDVWVLTKDILLAIGQLLGLGTIALVIGYLKELFKWAKKKGYKFFGFGDGDDDDDDDDSGGGGNVPQVIPENIPENIQDGLNESRDDTGEDGGDGGDGGEGNGNTSNQLPQQQQQQPTDPVMNFLQQQKSQQAQAQAQAQRLEVDSLLQKRNQEQTEETEKETEKPATPEKKEDTTFTYNGKTYTQYKSFENFMDKEGNKLPALRKEKPLKTKGLTDKEIYEKYYASRYSTGDLGNVFDDIDKKPETEPSAVPLADVAEQYGPMGTNIDTGIGHTTPDSYWNTIANYGDTAKNMLPSVPLAPTSALLVGGALGASAFRAYQNIFKPELTSYGQSQFIGSSDMQRPEFQSQPLGSVASRGRPFGGGRQRQETQFERITRLGI